MKPVSPLLIPLLDYNRWIESKDTSALMSLRARTRDNPELVGYNSLAAAYLAEIEIKMGRKDSLERYRTDMVQGVESTDDATQKSFVLKIIGNTCEALGDYKESVRYLNKSIEVAHENVTSLSSDKYGAAETERMFAEVDRAVANERRKVRVRFWSLVAIAVGLISGCVWGMFRVIRKNRRRREDARKKLDESRRSELSMALNMREREKQIEELRQLISSLADSELIDSAAARRIESNIRSNEGASKADKEFGKVFSSISPEFQTRLREKYPRIGSTSLRMAEYIAIGMDNRHIARVMNIRPESVKQNRWRLRQGLGLSEEDNLDTILRDML